MMSVGHVLDYVLDHMIIGLVTAALQKVLKSVATTLKKAAAILKTVLKLLKAPIT